MSEVLIRKLLTGETGRLTFKIWDDEKSIAVEDTISRLTLGFLRRIDDKWGFVTTYDTVIGEPILQLIVNNLKILNKEWKG